MSGYTFTPHPTGWSWWNSLTFGSIMSATDPVAVVALLKELGASKIVSTLMEGESLMNDGTAIVVFNVCLALSKGADLSGGDVVLMFLRFAVGGVLWGWLCAKLMTFCLARVFNDALIEITLTISTAYLTFYVAEDVISVSGVLAVVQLGLETARCKTHISPEVEAFLHRFWGMMAYLANTLIFVLVGVVIVLRAFEYVEAQDWFNLLVLYVGLCVIRGVVISALIPVLDRLGYGMDWPTAVVMTWGGLRGAVGLALALVVEHDPAIRNNELNDSHENAAQSHKVVGGKILFHTAGIVMLTLIINATSIRSLLALLKMNELSATRRGAMAHAVGRIHREQDTVIESHKEDHFLADALWSRVWENCRIQDPYLCSPDIASQSLRQQRHCCPIWNRVVPNEEDDKQSSSMESVDAKQKQSMLQITPIIGRPKHQCDVCNTSFEMPLREDELSEAHEHARGRYVKAQKRSFWRQYESGIVGRESVRVLNAIADEVLDVKGRLITESDLAPYFKLPPRILKIKPRIERWIGQAQLGNREYSLGEGSVFKHWCWKIVHWKGFEPMISVIVCLNVSFVIAELTHGPDDGSMYTISNYIFTLVYFIEFVLKIVALRKNYFKNWWYIFDFCILLLSIIDIVVDHTASAAGSDFSPALLKVARVLRVLRSLRAFKLFRLVLPLTKEFIDRIINQRLGMAYDIGKATVVALDETHLLLPHISQIDEVSDKLRKRADMVRENIVSTLAQLQQEHPAIVSAVKTRQASRSVLNRVRDIVRELREDGVMDEGDTMALERAYEFRMKRLENLAPSLAPAPPESMLRAVPWLKGVPKEAVLLITAKAKLHKLNLGHQLGKIGDPSAELYFIVSGVVRITFRVGNEDRVYTNFAGAGNVLGEMGLLTGATRSANMFCQTPVQLFSITATCLESAMSLYPALADALWRVCGIRAAVTALAAKPLYTQWPSRKLKLHCERAQLFTSTASAHIMIDDSISEAMILEGQGRCSTTGKSIQALQPITRGISSVRLPINCRFLIIPANDPINAPPNTKEAKTHFVTQNDNSDSQCMVSSSLNSPAENLGRERDDGKTEVQLLSQKDVKIHNDEKKRKLHSPLRNPPPPKSWLSIRSVRSAACLTGVGNDNGCDIKKIRVLSSDSSHNTENY